MIGERKKGERERKGKDCTPFPFFFLVAHLTRAHQILSFQLWINS
jgi:hypothetical protein